MIEQEGSVMSDTLTKKENRNGVKHKQRFSHRKEYELIKSLTTYATKYLV